MKTNIGKLFGLIPLGKKMYQKKRVALMPKKIKAHDSLSRIIKKAQEIEMRIADERPEYTEDYIGYKALGELQLEQRKGE